MLSARCPNCASLVRPDAKFCDECGAALVSGAVAAGRFEGVPLRTRSEENGTTAERRLVSILFADLVGFTPLSEKRDAEEVRDLLTRYFDACRAVVTRYGGSIEKFIGDAVMAVWGAPVAFEDDAERAVRAALDLVDAVAALGREIEEPGLQVRAGVLTGEAAVTLGAEAQGMVAGSLVNTAARIQSEASPGTVLVGDATRAASEAAVVYEDIGARTLKGVSEPVQLWRALRVVALRGGAEKSEGLEAPFIGRDRELRLMKDLFHASAEEHKAHLVSVVGIAGIGKSRLCWEFYKYIDGISDVVYTHRGRCLAYGEGVTYWAVAEMVRMRAGISEADETATALKKLQACLTEFIPDDDERRWVQPRLAHLLALEEHATQERDELFSAWRLFFERLADQEPTALVFEDMQWADTSLLEFIESLLEWSRNHALFVVTIARPELTERHSTWGAGKRNFTSVFLEPLAPDAMERVLDGLVPGLPDGVREQILRRAEGVPLYAVETVRMLLDRGVVERAGQRLPPDRSCRGARRAAEPACGDRRTPRRPRARGTPDPAGRSGARQDIHACAHLRQSAACPLTAPSTAWRARSQGDPFTAGRSALTRARAVRVPPGPREAGRLRNALETGPEVETPRGGRVVRDGVGWGRG